MMGSRASGDKARIASRSALVPSQGTGSRNPKNEGLGDSSMFAPAQHRPAETLPPGDRNPERYAHQTG